jgi:hypothetical protein
MTTTRTPPAGPADAAAAAALEPLAAAGAIRPDLLARIAGAIYLVIIVVGVLGEVAVRDRIIVAGDAAATAANVVAMESAFRLSIAGELFYLVLAVPMLLILYILLRPVSRELALLLVFFNLVSISVEAVNKLNLLAALFPQGGAGYLAAFEPAQLEAMTRLSFRLFGHGFGISLIFFGAACLVLGWLLYRSGFFPRALGVLLALAGAAYLVNSFTMIVAPGLAARLFPAILIPPFIGESALCLWLLIRGVNVQQWRARAAFARAW